MKLKIIKSAKEYSKALSRVEELMDATPGSPKEEELELWALLVERYEEENFPMDLPDPVEAIKFRMEQEGLRQKDLEKYFPGKSRVSEILNHKRSLSIGMIRALHHGLGIPAEVLIREVAA
jgi:HTH-type transcriptional regulator/antitoxin HigA